MQYKKLLNLYGLPSSTFDFTGKMSGKTPPVTPLSHEGFLSSESPSDAARAGTDELHNTIAEQIIQHCESHGPERTEVIKSKLRRCENGCGYYDSVLDACFESFTQPHLEEGQECDRYDDEPLKFLSKKGGEEG